MKKLLTLFSLFLMLSGVALAQFEGIITYSVEMEGLPPEAAAMMGDMEVKMFYKGNKTRTETTNAMTSSTTVNDNDSKESFTLMDIMGEKYMIKGDKEDKNKNVTEPEIKYIDGETKEIAGYKCKKAEIIMKDKDGKAMSMFIWYTDEIKARSTRKEYKGLNGFPLQMTIKERGFKQTLTAKKVSKETVSDNVFMAPKDGYKVTTWEEFNSEMQKMQGGQ